MKKRKLYTCHTKKLMLASMISLGITNYAYAETEYVDYSNQSINNVLRSNYSDSLNFTADNSFFIYGFVITAGNDISAEMTNTAVSDEAGLNNARAMFTSMNGNVTIVANNYTSYINTQASVSSSALYATAVNGDVDMTLNNSTVPRYLIAQANNVIIKVNDSKLGAVGAATDSGYIVQEKAIINEGGKTELDVSNSQIIGDMYLSSIENGNNIINFNNKSTVNGNLNSYSPNSIINIDDSTLSGNITTGNISDTATNTANTTVNIANSVYRGNITSTNNKTDDSLTLNVNNGGIVGGETVDTSQKITGFNSVSANINYVDPSLVNTGKASYFFFNEGEEVKIANAMPGNYIADTVRTGSYVLDRMSYEVTDESAKQGLADQGYYSITFTANEMPPTPLKPPLPPLPPEPTPPNPDPTPDPTPDPVPDPIPDPAPAPAPAPRIAADLQAAQAGLLASDDMIHRISGSITQHLDARHMGENSAQTADSNVWMDGIYSGGDRTAGTTEYSNDISGFQLGADTSWALANGDTLSIGAGLGYLHNDLDVTSSDGSNDIDGNYYSLYAGWTQHQAEGQNWHLFADTTATYGDMSYSASGKDGKVNAGGDYDGNSWLWQARVGAQVNLAQDWWVQPYTVLGYSQTETDAYNDGYSHVADGKFSAGFAGAGVKAGKNITLKGGQVLRPYIETSYVGRFSEDTKFNTSDYNFGGQNLNGGSIGAGLNAQLSKNWSTTAKVNTLVASDVSNEVHAFLGAEFKF